MLLFKRVYIICLFLDKRGYNGRNMRFFDSLMLRLIAAVKESTIFGTVNEYLQDGVLSMKKLM